MATIGLISPPVGLTVFVIQAQNPDIPAAKIYRGTLPFLVADFVLVALLVAFPALALWLPSVLNSGLKEIGHKKATRAAAGDSPGAARVASLWPFPFPDHNLWPVTAVATTRTAAPASRSSHQILYPFFSCA